MDAFKKEDCILLFEIIKTCVFGMKFHARFMANLRDFSQLHDIGRFGVRL